MRDNEGFEILHNGVPRSYRDQRETAYEAARLAKSRAKGEIIELVDRSTRTMMPLTGRDHCGQSSIVTIASARGLGID